MQLGRYLGRTNICYWLLGIKNKIMEKQIEFYQNKLDFEMDPSDLYNAIESGESIVPLDTRQPIGFEKEHIPGAINIPHRTMDENSTRHLDRTKLYICYCDGIGCNASTKGALNMTKLGFTVKELTGGIEWWKFDGYATEGNEKTDGLSISCSC
jgi:rhodanese-related sulfurtransferase